MRHHLITAAFIFSSFTPLAARAQSEDDVETSSPEGSVPVANPREPKRPSAEQPPPPTTGGRDSANTQHTVERGDTLWDLSQRYLGSPWYWPKVWSYNPEIANPHWIYPGNLVRFYQSGEEVPTQVEVGQQEAPDVDEGAMVDEGDRVQVTGALTVPERNYMTVALPGFVTSGEIEGSGTIDASFAETTMLSYPQTFYVKFKRAPKLGEGYVIFRTGTEIMHPWTGKSVGFLTQILGEARVQRLEKNGYAVMEIVRQFYDFQRGDLLGPSGESVIRKVAARPADRDVKDGRIVAGMPIYLDTLAEHQVVIIDRGSDDGVKLGNVFTIWRRHDAIPQDIVLNPTIEDEALPTEDVGACISMEVKSKTTVCLLARSLRELVRGDHADIRARRSGRAAR
jgi:hypothetical protein